MRRILIFGLLGLLACCLLAAVAALLPPVRERLAWRVENAQAQFQRWLNPPEAVVFVPAQTGPGAAETRAAATLAVLLTSATPGPASPTAASPDSLTAESTAAPTGEASPASPTPEPPTPTFTPSPTPIPAAVKLQGVRHEYQVFNNCGPANLSMTLSYWGWQGSQTDTRAFLRPNLKVDDKNVNPEEMVAFVQGSTGLRALARVGGERDLLRRLIAAGFPVIIEKGHDPADDSWMGHYLTLDGYDDAAGRFIAQDSLIMPDLPLPYAELEGEWRDFNRAFVVVYAPEREAELLALLGPLSDPAGAYRYAAEQSLAEIPNLQGRPQFFAWFALGSSLAGLGDYPGAADAYDQAFAIYAALPEDERPYRLMWYQSGPYQAYYNTGRYQDVVTLANTTFSWVGKPVLEESYYWRGLAYLALGNQNQAIADLTKAASLNPNYAPPRQELQKLGAPLP